MLLASHAYQFIIYYFYATKQTWSPHVGLIDKNTRATDLHYL